MIRRGAFLFALFACTLLEARLYFIHVPKTGGTTLRYLLEMQVGMDEIYPYRNEKDARESIHHELISGHLPSWLCAQLDPDFEKSFKVTILRDPIERYLSFLRAKKRKNNRHPTLESVMEERFSPHSPYKLGLRKDAMCRFFAGQPHLEGEELLKSAIKGLEKFDCVLFFDHFSADVIDLFRCFDIHFDEEDIPKMNATKKEEVSPELLEEIRKENLWDLELYRYAKENIRKKEASYDLRGSFFEETVRPSSYIDYSFEKPLLGRGWSYREKSKDHSLPFPVCRWIMDQPASIYFSLHGGKDYTLSFLARPYAEDNLVRVTVNGHEMELKREKKDRFFRYSGKIEKEWMNGSLAEITFHPQKAFPYAESFHSHHLLVSFAIHRIEIAPQ